MEALFIAAAIERIQLFLFNVIIHILIFTDVHVITSVSILNAINFCVFAFFDHKTADNVIMNSSGQIAEGGVRTP